MTCAQKPKVPSLSVAAYLCAEVSSMPVLPGGMNW